MTFFGTIGHWLGIDPAAKAPEPTLRGTGKPYTIVDDTAYGTSPLRTALDGEAPKVAYVPNRKQKRDYAHSLRTRTRNTKFSQRSKSRSGKGLHADANNKSLQFILNTWLQVLWMNARLWNTEKLA